jgi:predicted nuclease of predicted toxin-antitoxin system
MRFLVDECTGPRVAAWLRNQNHDVFSVFDEAMGMDDEGIITKALEDTRILITNDKGFGEKVFRDGRLHRGVILLRLEDERPASKIRVISHLLKKYSSKIAGAFIVATERQVRFAKSDKSKQP